MKANFLINNLNAGEISPKLDARSDLQKYGSACGIMENFLPMREGGAKSRPGLYYSGPVKDHSKKVRLIPFQFNSSQAYILEFGDEYVRFWTNDAQVVVADVPYEIASPYLVADLFKLQQVGYADTVYMANDGYAPRKLVRAAADEWSISEVAFNPPPMAARGHYPEATLTPEALTGLGVRFTASAGVFINGDIDREIVSGPSKGTIVGINSAGTMAFVDITDPFLSTSAIAAGDWRIQGDMAGKVQVNKIKPLNATVNVTASTDTSETNISFINDSLEWIAAGTGTAVYYCQKKGGGDPEIPAPGAVNEDASAMTHNTLSWGLSAGQWRYGDHDTLGFDTLYVRLSDDADPDEKTTGYVNGDYTGLISSSIFRDTDVGSYLRIFGGTVRITSFVSALKVKAKIVDLLDVGSVGAVYDSTPEFMTPVWSADLGYPSSLGFLEQRLGWAGTDSYPNSVWYSKSQDYENHLSNPDEADAAIMYTLATGYLDRIRWLNGVQYSMLGSASGIHKIGSSSIADALSQTNVDAPMQAKVGCKDLGPVILNDWLMFVQSAGFMLQGVQYDYQSDKYKVRNLTRLASHITYGATEELSGIVQMDVQIEPYPIVWCVRADGQLLGMLFDSDENVFAWFRVVTDGEIESVAVIHRDGKEDQVWVSVKRTINGEDKRYIEYFYPQNIFSDINNALCVDSGLKWDGGGTMTVEAITNDTNCQVTVDDASDLSEGDFIQFYGTGTWLDDNVVVVAAGTLSGNTFLLSNNTDTGPIDSMDTDVFPPYTSGGTVKVVKSIFTGLDHLEGETVKVVGDGAVQADQVVTAGSVTIERYANKVQIGLGFTCDVSPMLIDVQAQDGTSRAKRKKISQVTLSFYETFGGKMGKDADNLEDIVFDTGGDPELYTGLIGPEPFDGEYNQDASFYIRQDLPMPMTVRSIMPILAVGND